MASAASVPLGKTSLHAGKIFLLAFLARLAVVLFVAHAKSAAWFFAQASELGEVAQSLVSGQGFSSPFPHTGPSAFLPPGYPLLVALLFKLFGSYSTSSAIALMVLQAAFGAAAVFFTTRVGDRFFSHRAAVITGLLCALHPWLISLSVVFWDTSCSVMLMSALLFTATRWLDEPTSLNAYLTVVIAVVAVFVNPALALTAVVLLAWCLYRSPQSRRSLVVPCLLFLALCSLWPLRNLHVMHAFIPLRDNLGYELWQGNRPGADGFFAAELHPNVNMAELHRYQSLGELKYMQQKSAIAKQAILASPSRFVGLSLKRTLCFWFGVSGQFALNQLFIALPTTLLGFTGLILLARRRGFITVMPLILPLALFPLPYYITHPDFRFWCILAPLLTASAVYACLPRKQDTAIQA